MLLVVEPTRPAPRKLRPAVDALERGDVIIYPTDTGYAFGCALSSLRGIAKLRKLKGIDERDPKPLTMLVNDIGDIARYGHLGNTAFRMVRRLLPGPYTLVLRATSQVPRQMKNRDKEVGLRVPDHPVCRLLVELLGEPLLTGSVTPAERGESELPAAEEPELLAKRFAGDVSVVLDAGPLFADPSTVLRMTDDEIVVLRAGQGAVPEL
jgi:tRNA threonylcarbamoyl adenosine modification protein (Sua5/YciO/YrdC/YwlC family)